MRRLHLDFETASTCDLRKAGAAVYAAHPSTRVLCVAYAFDDAPIRTGMTLDLMAALNDPDTVICAWNAAFEAAILEHVAKVPLPPARFRCTMARAAYWGLPMSLGDAAEALNVVNRKSKAGHSLMMRMCKPRGYDPIDGTPRWWHEDEPDKLIELTDYCKQDVATERDLHRNTPDMPAREQAIWELDQRVNRRGVQVDETLRSRLVAITGDAQVALARSVKDLTQGQVKKPTEVSKLLAWLRERGFPHDNLRRQTITERLKEDTLPPEERAGLRIRADAARASTAKLASMGSAQGADGRIRGLLQYYGAGRTGRWAGRLVQPQNFPRGAVKGAQGAIPDIRAGRLDAAALDMLFPDSPLAVVASCLRGCFAARPGHVLLSGDLSQIEARVVAWLAGQQDILDVFARGEDVYVYTAGRIGSTDRQLGKVCVLGLGFGMGPPKFQATARTYGLILDESFTRETVWAWREANGQIVAFWYACGDAAIRLARGEPGPIDVGRLRFHRRGRTMMINLPSGRDLVYRGIEATPDDTGRLGVTYMGVHQQTRRWTRIRTYGGKLVENVTQAVARDVMAEAMLEVDRRGIPIVLTVHDELVSEIAADRAKQGLDTVLKIMRTAPAWAPGLPVNAEGWMGERYRK